MNKFDFEYVYEYSAQRYHKTIEAATEYEAYAEFNKQTMNDKAIIVCNVKKIK